MITGMEIWDDIHKIEEQIYNGILRIDEAGPDIQSQLVEHVSKLIANHSRMINEALQIYSTIDFFSQSREKVNYKAHLKYSLQILDFCSNLIRYLDKSDIITLEIRDYIEKIENIVVNREVEIKTKFIYEAKKELSAFHNQTFRNKLELDLASKLIRMNKISKLRDKSKNPQEDPSNTSVNPEDNN